MAYSASPPTLRKQAALFLVFLFLVSVTSLATQAADSDGDGVLDSADDCPWAAGNSTIDRDGCPDQNKTERPTLTTRGHRQSFQNEFTTSSSDDYYGVDYSPSGEFIVWVPRMVSSGSGMQAWTNLRSANTGTDVNGLISHPTVFTSLPPSTTTPSTSTTAQTSLPCMEASALMLEEETK